MDRSLTVDSSSVTESGLSTKMRKKMDVYSCGVMLLELITREKAVDSSFPEGDIVSRVKSYSGKEDAVTDEGLRDEEKKSAVKREMVGMIRISLKCTEDKAEERPSMGQVVEMLRDEIFKFGVEFCKVQTCVSQTYCSHQCHGFSVKILLSSRARLIF